MPRRRNQQRTTQRSDSPDLADVAKAEHDAEEEQPQPQPRPTTPQQQQQQLAADPDAHAPTAELEQRTAARPALAVLYCEVCSFPPEFCEFGSHLTKCKTWLAESRPDLYERYYSEDALVSKAESLTTEAARKLEQDTKKKEAKADAKAESAAKKRAASKVTIKRIERTKRKHITAVHGLEAFDVDLKKAAKLFAQTFATGASVSRNAAGQDEIVVQGDVSAEVEDMLVRGGGALGRGVEGEIVCVEVRGKKGGAAE